jgi:hypothetical protein
LNLPTFEFFAAMKGSMLLLGANSLSSLDTSIDLELEKSRILRGSPWFLKLECARNSADLCVEWCSSESFQIPDIQTTWKKDQMASNQNGSKLFSQSVFRILDTAGFANTTFPVLIQALAFNFLLYF